MCIKCLLKLSLPVYPPTYPSFLSSSAGPARPSPLPPSAAAHTAPLTQCSSSLPLEFQHTHTSPGKPCQNAGSASGGLGRAASTCIFKRALGAAHPTGWRTTHMPGSSHTPNAWHGPSCQLPCSSHSPPPPHQGHPVPSSLLLTTGQAGPMTSGTGHCWAGRQLVAQTPPQRRGSLCEPVLGNHLDPITGSGEPGRLGSGDKMHSWSHPMYNEETEAKRS